MKHTESHHKHAHHDHHEDTDHHMMMHHEANHDHHAMNHAMHDMGDLKQRFLVSLIFGIPVLFLAPLMGISLPFQFSFAGSEWVVVGLSTLLFFYGGSPFLKGAKNELTLRSPAMMTLISLGISVAYFYSLYAFVSNTFFHTGVHVMDFFWELASLILIMLLGHWIEMKALESAGDALQSIANLLPSEVSRVLEDGSMETVSLKTIAVGDYVLVKSGESIPVDGTVVSGDTSVNESMITGEARAVSKKTGDRVVGGSINGSGTITVAVNGTGETGYLAQVMRMVDEATRDKSKLESLADIVAKWLFYVAVAVGITAGVVWSVMAGIDLGVQRMVTVLVIACPHALGLAIPLVVARSTSIAAKHGLLIKSRQAIEAAEHVDVVVMDKTGTLTEGSFSVIDYRSLHDEYPKEDILRYAASLEQHSSHPLAIGIVNKAQDDSLGLWDAKNVQTLAGVGITGIIQQHDVKITSLKYVRDHPIEYDAEAFEAVLSQGYSISVVLIDDVVAGFLAQGDQIKDEAAETIRALKDMGIRTVMLTGDNEQAAEAVGYHLGIDDIHSELLPEDKEEKVAYYRNQGLTVVMVGDGVNDAPSLARADVGIAIGSGTDVAVDSADVILVRNNPADILSFIRLAKRTSRKMKENLIWGAGYNLIAIPLAAGILAGVGILLTPAAGAILMSASTVIVAINAMVLKLK